MLYGKNSGIQQGEIDRHHSIVRCIDRLGSKETWKGGDNSLFPRVNACCVSWRYNSNQDILTRCMLSQGAQEGEGCLGGDLSQLSHLITGHTAVSLFDVVCGN
jgi:hypothetical protein